MFIRYMFYISLDTFPIDLQHMDPVAASQKLVT